MESAGLWGLPVKVPFRLAPWSSVQCIFKLPPYYVRLPEYLPALTEVFCRECLLADLWARLLEGEQGDLVCSPEPRWPGVRDSRGGVWWRERVPHPLLFLPPFHLWVKSHHLVLY